MNPIYDYLFLTLSAAGGAAQRRLAQAFAAAKVASGAQMAALFSPQLGWAGNEAAILTRGADPGALVKALGDLVVASQHHSFSPTARPTGDEPPAAGGIYVHRWFTVGAGDVGEFVNLSAQAWPSFERQFDTHIFGLFQADRTAEDTAADQVRLMLLTRYKDHGVWEASRDPTTDAMQIFARRQALTRWTRACSTLLAGS